MSSADPVLELPPDFADYDWEVVAKGCFSGASITVDGQRYRLVFYDTVRLGQEIESELERGGTFFEPNLLVVRSVTRECMEEAVDWLVRSRQLDSFVPEPEAERPDVAAWYEVWADESSTPPCLLLLSVDVPAAKFRICDPALAMKVVFEAGTYEQAKNWLLEDEFMKVRGRMSIDDGWS